MALALVTSQPRAQTPPRVAGEVEQQVEVTLSAGAGSQGSRLYDWACPLSYRVAWRSRC